MLGASTSRGPRVGGWADWEAWEGCPRTPQRESESEVTSSQHLLGARGCMWVAAIPTATPEGATSSSLCR